MPGDAEGDRLDDRTPLRMIDEWSQAHFLVRAMPVLMRVRLVAGPAGPARSRRPTRDHGRVAARAPRLVRRDRHLDDGRPRPASHRTTPVSLQDSDEEAATQLLDALDAARQRSRADRRRGRDDRLRQSGGHRPPRRGHRDRRRRRAPPDRAGAPRRPARRSPRAASCATTTARPASPGCGSRTTAGAGASLERRCTDLTDHPAIGGLVLNARDVTDESDAILSLVTHAYTDELTGLPNRVRLRRPGRGPASGASPAATAGVPAGRLRSLPGRERGSTAPR